MVPTTASARRLLAGRFRSAPADTAPADSDIDTEMSRTLTSGLPTLPSHLDAMRIVVIEDSAADAELLIAMLEMELPHAVTSLAATVHEGLVLLTSPVDAVITDLSLPDADGLSALHAIRGALPDTAVLVLTGHNDSEVGMAAMLAGADDYLIKGTLDSRSLATTVQYAVQRRNVTRESRRFERLALSLLDAMESPTCAVTSSGTIIAVNDAWSSYGPVASGSVDIGRNYFALCEEATTVDSASMAAVIRGLQNVLAGLSPRFQLDYASAGPADMQWYSVRINPLPEAAGAVLTHVDVTVAKRAEEALSHQTLHDGLTNLPNRDLLGRRLAHALATAEITGRVVGVGFLDLDQFKRVNDSLGHQAGDDLLLAVSQRLRTQLRTNDTLARFAGDEFVAVWPDLANASDAPLLAERMRALFEEPFRLEQGTVSLTASIGVAVGAAPQLPDDLLLAADAAMYDAKARGRGRTRMFSGSPAELREGAQSRRRIEAEMRQALTDHQFMVHYQPVVDLRRGQVRGVEALVRWLHPEGLRMPDSFIPVAESSGLIVPLGAWVLNEACRQAVAWQREGLELDVAVNLSARQLSHPNIVATVGDALTTSGLQPDRLMLEVTESAMLEDAEAALVVLSEIANLGATIAIDDFGTGYSSLLYLKRYPVRALKVDRSFVSGMTASNEDRAIVTSVVSLAAAVGSVSVAEGVETQEQHAALRAMGCDYAQGYLFGKPVAASEIALAVARCSELLLDTPAEKTAAASVAPTLIIEQFVFDRITQMHHAGASLHTIAAALNREEAPHPGARRWHSTTVAQIIAGNYHPLTRRRAAALVRPAALPLSLPARHRPLLYTDLSEVVHDVSDSLDAALGGSEAVLVLATPTERFALEGELRRRGHDLEALALTSQYRAWDSATVFREITVDDYVSGHLFRHVVGRRVETALHRFGRAHVYAGISGWLWKHANPASALALEAQWQNLAARLEFDLVCGYPRTVITTVGSDEDRRCLQDHHPAAP